MGAIIDTPLCSAFAFAGDVLAAESLSPAGSLPEAAPAEPLDPRGVPDVFEAPLELLPALPAEELAGAAAEAADEPAAGFAEAEPVLDPALEAVAPDPVLEPVPEAVDGLPLAEPAEVADFVGASLVVPLVPAEPEAESPVPALADLAGEAADPVDEEDDAAEPEPVAVFFAEFVDSSTDEVPAGFAAVSAAADPGPVSLPSVESASSRDSAPFPAAPLFAPPVPAVAPPGVPEPFPAEAEGLAVSPLAVAVLAVVEPVVSAAPFASFASVESSASAAP
ncbi:hypothetical protein ACFQZ2_03560 [Streptomonospora algeriensis]|uniref:Uncharacterized protein n=1 Tax=Streptomonospora algeriensis TaxID=995084 RepID=A0ABW3B9Z3_9ACTN